MDRNHEIAKRHNYSNIKRIANELDPKESTNETASIICGQFEPDSRRLKARPVYGELDFGNWNI